MDLDLLKTEKFSGPLVGACGWY